MKNNKNSYENSRREFIKKTSAGLLSTALLGALPVSFANSLSGFENKKSKVVLVRHSKVVDPDGNVDTEVLNLMIEEALSAFSGEKDSKYLWKKLFSTDDIIGIKVNLLGLNSLAGSNSVQHFSAVTNAVIQNAANANLRSENFIVWDRNNEEFAAAGLKIEREAGKTKFYGTMDTKNDSIEKCFSNEITVEDKSTRVSRIITETCTALINIPVLKDHGLAGITGALKNHYGSISNPREFHSNNCTSPGIPEINALPQIREKQKLIIADAIMGVFNGGPRWNRDYMWNYGGILVSTDPVAIDRVMFGIINEKRKAEGMSEISGNSVRHIKLSAELNLGKYLLSEIELNEVILG